MQRMDPSSFFPATLIGTTIGGIAGAVGATLIGGDIIKVSAAMATGYGVIIGARNFSGPHNKYCTPVAPSTIVYKVGRDIAESMVIGLLADASYHLVISTATTLISPMELLRSGAVIYPIASSLMIYACHNSGLLDFNQPSIVKNIYDALFTKEIPAPKPQAPVAAPKPAEERYVKRDDTKAAVKKMNANFNNSKFAKDMQVFKNLKQADKSSSPIFELRPHGQKASPLLFKPALQTPKKKRAITPAEMASSAFGRPRP